MADIFISYSRKDIAFARLLNQALSSSDLDTWIDWERIPVGEQWWNEIREAIEQSNIFMFIISRHSLGSPVCKDEINIAMQNNKRIIPIILDDLTRDSIDEFIPDLSKIQWIVFHRDQTFQVEEYPLVEAGSPEDQSVAKPRPPFFDEAIAKLNTVIHIDWEWVKYHTQLQNDALQWDNNHRNESFLLRGEVLEQAEGASLSAIQKEPRLTQLQVEFINTSRQAEKRQQDEKKRLEKRSVQRLRWVIAVVVMGLAAAIFLGINWYLQSQRAQKQATIALSRQLAAQALSEADSQFDLSALLSIESLNVADNNDAKSALLTAYEDHPALVKILHHQAGVSCMALSPDGEIMATGKQDGTIQIWNIPENSSSEMSVLSYAAHDSMVTSLAFSPDGKTLATSSEDRSIWLWDVSNAYAPQKMSQIVGELTGPVEVVAFSHDGKTLASGNDDNSIRLWDVSDLKSPKSLGQPILGHSGWVNSLVFSQDDTVLASGGQDGFIGLWDVSDPKSPRALLQPSEGFMFMVRGLALSPDGKTLAFTRLNILYLIDITDPASPVELAKLFTNNSDAYDVYFSPDGKTLGTWTDDGIVWLWDITDPLNPVSIKQPILEEDKVFINAIFSTDGMTFVSLNSDNDIEIWNIANPSFPQAISQPLGNTLSAAYGMTISPDGNTLATGNMDGTQLWDVSNPASPRPVGQPINDNFSDDDRFIQNLFGNFYSINLTFSPDQNTLLRWSMGENIEIWDVSDINTPSLTGQLQNDASKEAIFSPDGKILATLTDAGVLLWDYSNPTNPQSFGQGLWNYGASSMAFLGDGKTLAVGYDEAILRLWDLTNPKRPQVINQPLSGFTGPIWNLAFSPQNNILAAGCSDGKVWLWDMSDPQNPQALGQPAGSDIDGINKLVFSPNGKVLASVSKNNIQLWDVSDPAHMVQLSQPLQGYTSGILYLVFTADGKSLITAGYDGVAWLWNIDTETWQSQACEIANRNLTYNEWVQYISSKAYHFTCPDLALTDSGVKEYVELAKSALVANDLSTVELAYSAVMEKLSGSNQSVYYGEICQHGSLDGFADIVLPACNTAVSMATQNNESSLSEYRYYRGIALALTGDYEGAVEDIQYFLDQPTEETGDYGTYWREKRESWIAALETDSNPFDEKTLQELRNQ